MRKSLLHEILRYVVFASSTLLGLFLGRHVQMPSGKVGDDAVPVADLWDYSVNNISHKALLEHRLTLGRRSRDLLRLINLTIPLICVSIGTDAGLLKEAKATWTEKCWKHENVEQDKEWTKTTQSLAQHFPRNHWLLVSPLNTLPLVPNIQTFAASKAALGLQLLLGDAGTAIIRY